MLRALGVLMVLALPSIAAADVVGPPPTSCPEGSIGTICHGLGYCRVNGCLSAADCLPGERCTARELCLETGECFGWGSSMTVSTVTGECSSSCAGRCESHFVCSGMAIDAGARDAGPRIDGGADAGEDPRYRHVRYCGCAVPSRSDRGAGAAAALTVLLLGLSRMRAARRRG